MRRDDHIEDILQAIGTESLPPDVQATAERVSKDFDGTLAPKGLRFASLWRIVMRSNLTKLAAAAAIVVAALFLWRLTAGTSKAYALTDVPRLIGQAKTIHVRTRHFSDGKALPLESWSDLENGRSYQYWEGMATEEGPNGIQAVKNAIATVFDGQFVMTVDHRKKTVKFERLLTSLQEPKRRMMADRALNGTLQDIKNFDQYARVDKGEIDGQWYDIWRREFRLAGSDLRTRYEYWVSPASGIVGRTRRWYNYGQNRDWELMEETDKIEINAEPPSDIFLTEPPADYTLSNQKATADFVGLDLTTFSSLQGHTLRAPTSFTLGDGSVLVCWRGTSTSVVSDPNEARRELSFGGELPQAPTELFALMSYPNENSPQPVFHYAGRHVLSTRRMGRTYEWALYVPPHPVATNGAADFVIAWIKLNMPDPAGWVKAHPAGNLTLRENPEALKIRMWQLTSLRVTPETFAQYVPLALRGLSENQAVPPEMTYERLLSLAERIRAMPQLYEVVRTEIREAQEHVAVLEPVKPEEIVTPEQVRQQAKQLVEAFYAAIVAGRDADAAKMLRYEEPRASRAVAGMKQLPGVSNIKVEQIYATEDTALVITNEFARMEGHGMRWAIGVIKEKGTWLIKDFDATTTETMQQEVNKCLNAFPKATHFVEQQ